MRAFSAVGREMQ